MKFLILSLMFVVSTSAFAASEGCTTLVNDLANLSESIGAVKGQIALMESLQTSVSIDLSQPIKQSKASLEKNSTGLEPLRTFIIEKCLK